MVAALQVFPAGAKWLLLASEEASDARSSHFAPVARSASSPNRFFVRLAIIAGANFSIAELRFLCC
jgi:hypothetical protein